MRASKFPPMPQRFLLAAVLALAAASPAHAVESAPAAWWVWPVVLFAASFLLGIVAVLAGVGGGVLFVPLIGGFFPFHLDFVRGAGLLLALSGALSAAPALLRDGMANLRLAMPFALVGSITSIAGALLGLALPTSLVQTALGITILLIAVLMWRSKRSVFPQVERGDRLAVALGLRAVFTDPHTGHAAEWRVHRAAGGMLAFAAIGMLAGMFGLGAGWANVPALNLLLGAPLKVSVATSGLMLSIVDTSAAWVYIHRGAVLPMLTVPSIVGVMLGANLGARLLRVTRAEIIRAIVIGLLTAAGLRALLKGTGIWN
ncbi:MAG: sulfite exporter TauE/SafE family protein [Burkholderiales bacterium]|nr:sulfite exporter TauE/SafE family protein [Burkholderiales bacterium]